jgi:hypothetical protein
VPCPRSIQGGPSAKGGLWQSAASSSLVQLVPPFVLGALLAVLLSIDTGAGVALLQSPVSPLPPTSAPTALPYTSPVIPGNVYPQPTVSPVRLPPPLLRPDAWSSPWTWAVAGLVLFGAAAWGLIVLFRRLQAGRDRASTLPPASIPTPETAQAPTPEPERASEIEIDIASEP